MIPNINKSFVRLNYSYNVPKEWLDFFYLTQTKKNILMCCKYSTFSLSASKLSGKKILFFKESRNDEEFSRRWELNYEILDN